MAGNLNLTWSEVAMHTNTCTNIHICTCRVYILLHFLGWVVVYATWVIDYFDKNKTEKKEILDKLSVFFLSIWKQIKSYYCEGIFFTFITNTTYEILTLTIKKDDTAIAQLHHSTKVSSKDTELTKTLCILVFGLTTPRFFGSEWRHSSPSLPSHTSGSHGGWNHAPQCNHHVCIWPAT